ncbi:MAG TPA: endolytic transglycosylase MltG [Campylobacterales bacterium]|nr:endolytic transglycosylase MltG [Campylobacterales bacterium]
MKIIRKFTVLLTTLTNTLGILTASMMFYITMPIEVASTTLKLPKGSVTHTINHLKKQGYQLSTIDTYFLVAIGHPKSGELEVGEGVFNRIDFLHKLTSATEAFDIITLIPGETRPIFLQELADTYQLSYAKLDGNYTRYSPYHEAGILPETYHVPKGIREAKLISFLVRLTEEKYQSIAQEYGISYDTRTWLRYLTIASVIQKEAANAQEMPIVASVIYNRLKKEMPLQMDGTLNYGKYSHVKVTPERIRNDKSRFNTYANTGLPPYPVCSVSIDAIKAALKPQQTNYLYFMKNKEGVHDFTHSYQEHLRNIAKAKRN